MSGKKEQITRCKKIFGKYLEIYLWWLNLHLLGLTASPKTGHRIAKYIRDRLSIKTNTNIKASNQIYSQLFANGTSKNASKN